jgi:hypothetical protein
MSYEFNADEVQTMATRMIDAVAASARQGELPNGTTLAAVMVVLQSVLKTMPPEMQQDDLVVDLRKAMARLFALLKGAADWKAERPS